MFSSEVSGTDSFQRVNKDNKLKYVLTATIASLAVVSLGCVSSQGVSTWNLD